MNKAIHCLAVLILATAAALIAGSSIAEEPVRLALLIGNKGYSQKVGPLKNPHNDVDLVATSLTKLGFKVTVLKDASYKAMDTALKRYVTDVRRAGRGAISFFYYSGHGVANPETQINYLIPIDVADADDDKVWFESFQQTTIIDLLSKQAPNATHYLVFDACRSELNVSGDNAKALGSEKGFVPINDTSGLLIAYATAPKRTASDVGEGGGPYAKVLAEELVKPDVEAVSMFRNVQIRVKQTIGQDPWLSFPSVPPVYLAGRSESQQPTSQAKEASSARQALATAMAEHQRLFGLEAEDEKNRAEYAVKAGQSFRDCPECPEMVVVQAGSFMMGSHEAAYDEEPVHEVTIPKPFAVGKFEVTFAEWDACVADGGCAHKPADEKWGRARRPVINVSWDDAKQYTTWLSKRTGTVYRLLSEAEWEYAARAGTTTRYSWGEGIGAGKANCEDCGSQWDGKQTAPVGSFSANAFGLHDMHGNVWEWVQDCWRMTYQGAPSDGSAGTAGDCNRRAIRGAAWSYPSFTLRSAQRNGDDRDVRSRIIGFRVGKTL
jgi:formylglycine-generating enzyme required for sulfatase activity